MLKKIIPNMYLVSAGLFFIISLLGFVVGKSMPSLIAGVVTSLLCVAFHFIFKPKWSEEAKNSLEEAFEKIKPFGDALPLSVIGKLQLVFIVLMFISMLQPIISKFIPSISFVFVVIGNIAFSLFLLGTFYNVFQGNLKSLLQSSKLFAIYSVIDIIATFVLEKFKVSTKSMCLFLVFWSLNILFTYMTSDHDPALDIPKKEKKEKVKKDKKSKKESSEEKADEVSADETPAE